jgi:hypothetical protein
MTSGRFHLDESIWVLGLVCGPLLALIAVIALLARGRRYAIRFADFSLTISKLGRNEAYVSYRAGNMQTEFPAAIGRGRSFFRPSISVVIPAELSQGDLHRIVSDLAAGLATLRYEYRIYGNDRSGVLARSNP